MFRFNDDFKTLLFKNIALYYIYDKGEAQKDKKEVQATTPPSSSNSYSGTLFNTLSTGATAISNAISQTANYVKNLATGDDADTVVIFAHFKQLQDLIKTCESPKDWLDLAIALGEVAEQTQKLKDDPTKKLIGWGKKQSRSCQNAHMNRACVMERYHAIVEEELQAIETHNKAIENNPNNNNKVKKKQLTDAPYFKALQDKRDALLCTIQELKSKMPYNRDFTNGTGNLALRESIKINLKKLAYLGLPAHIDKALNWNCFPYLLSIEETATELGILKSAAESHPKRQLSWPYCFQFWGCGYQDIHQQNTKVGLLEFSDPAYRIKLPPKTTVTSTLPIADVVEHDSQQEVSRNMKPIYGRY